MSDVANVTITGFDLGHAETALSRTYGDGSAAPEPIPLAGADRGRPLLTLVGVRPDGSVLVGQAASNARPPINIFMAFKSPDFNAETVSRPIRLFVETVIKDATARGNIPAQGDVRWIFGSPSGWSAEARRQYTSLLREIGLRSVKVVPESRAALLYARDCGEVKVDAGRIRGSVLIVDIGSSTTDYTVVRNLKSTPVDHGNIKLGASVIDGEIMRLVMRRGDLPPAARELVTSCPSERRRLELLCRKAKEVYFSAPEELNDDPEAERGVSDGRLFTREGRPVDVSVYLNQLDMDEVLNAPQEALGGRTWPAAFREDLGGALKSLGQKPDLLLLTGGPSQMLFVVSICREAVGDSRVAVGSAPEFAISRGLALAGRVEVRTEGFRRDVSRLLDSTQIATTVADRLPALAKNISDTIAEGITDRYVIPMFKQWRDGEIPTLDAMTDRIGERINRDLVGGANSKLSRIIADWQNGVQLRIEQKTRPICDRWDIPPGAMRLSPVDVVSGRVVEAPVDTTVVTGVLNGVGNAISAVVAVVLANLLFGAGTAIVAATGPFGVLVAGGALLGGAIAGKEAILEKARSVSIPISARKMLVSEESLDRKLRAKADASEAALAEAIVAKILESESLLVEQTSAEVAKELEEKAREIELLIALPEAEAETSGGDQTRPNRGNRQQPETPGDAGETTVTAPGQRKTPGSAENDTRRGDKQDRGDKQEQFTMRTPDRLPTFKQVGGMEQVKADLSETIGLLLAYPEEAADYRITYNGVLLHGPAGTGKSFLAQATAGEFGMNFMRVSVAELISKFIGESAQNVAAAFVYAAANVPCLLLFEELDSVAARRDDEPNAENRRVINQLLTSLEEYRSLRELLVIATTNDLNRLDPAVVRGGRFDRHVRVDLPNLPAREAILVAQLQGRPTEPNADLARVARRSEGLTAAALTVVVEEAAMAAFRETTASVEQVPITTGHLLQALAARGGKDRPTVDESWSWDRLVLDDATKQELQQLQMLLEDPDWAAGFGIEPPRGVLLIGPPGTGKTATARVLAAQSHCSFYPTTGTDLTSKWVGESEGKVARLFSRARDNAPSIVFIDEIDGVGAARGELGGGWADRLLNQLLAEIDGLSSRARVLVVGATNRPKILDPALTGRLSRTFRIGLPDAPARRRLLELHAARMPLEEVDLDRLAERTEGLSGRNLKDLCDQAGTIAAMTRRERSEGSQLVRPRVTMADFDGALRRQQR